MDAAYPDDGILTAAMSSPTSHDSVRGSSPGMYLHYCTLDCEMIIKAAATSAPNLHTPRSTSDHQPCMAFALTKSPPQIRCFHAALSLSHGECLTRRQRLIHMQNKNRAELHLVRHAFKMQVGQGTSLHPGSYHFFGSRSDNARISTLAS
jgi:hypothetical protein